MKYFGNFTNSPKISHRDLMLMTGFSSVGVVNRSIKKLIKLGFLKKNKNDDGESHQYHIILQKILQNGTNSPLAPTKLFVPKRSISEKEWNYIFSIVGYSCRTVFNLFFTGSFTTKQVSEKLNISYEVARRRCNKLEEYDLIEKDDKLWQISELDWQDLLERFNVRLQINAQKEKVKTEREIYKSQQRKWVKENR